MRYGEAEAILARLAASVEASHRAQLELLEAMRLLILEPRLTMGEEKAATSHSESDPELAALDAATLDGLPDSAVFTVDDVAKLLRISRNTAYELVRQKRIPSLALGRQIRIPRRGLVAFLRGMDADAFNTFVQRKAREKEDRK